MANHKKGSSSKISELDGERGMPSVNESSSSTQRGLIVVCMVLFILLTGTAAYWKYNKNKDRESQMNKKVDAQIESAVPAHTFDNVPAKTGMSVPGTLSASAPPMPNDTSGGSSSAILDKADSDLMTVDNKVVNENSTSVNNNSTPESQGGALSGSLVATETPLHSAKMLGNRNFILSKGSFINCVLQTKLDSTVPGMTECRVTRNIYSDNGKILLIERGSTVSGEYQSNMRQGMARIFVLWNRIKTPNGVVIPLDSPGADPLGGSGLPGYVDNHFWQRFGGALMLSLIDDAAKGYIASKQQGPNGQANFNFNSTSNASQTMAAEALRNTINIPPTLYKNQGDEIGIYVARDLNFSSVYDVAAE